MKFAIAMLVVLLAGCVTDPAETQVAIEFTAKVKTNMVEMLCSQPAYQKCVKQTRDECVTRLMPHRQLCVDRATQAEGSPNTKAGLKRFVEANVACLVMRDFPFSSEKEIEEYNSCHKNTPIDRDLLLKELLRKN